MADAKGTEHGTTLGRDTRTVSLLTLVSRVMGLVRDLVTVRIFGDTAVGSAFAAGFAVPNMFRRLFGEGALSAAFLPRYTTVSDEDPARAGALASLVVGALALVTGVITVVVEAALVLVILLAPGGEGSERSYALMLVMVMLPFMPLICVAAILGGMLQSHGRFGPWAAAPLLLNVCVIGASVPYFFVEGAAARDWAVVIGVAAVVSAGLQVLWSLWALKGRVRWTRAVDDARGEARVMLRAMVPVLIGLGTLQLNTFADTLIAMYPNWVGGTLFGREYPLDEASNAVLFYAQRLYQFPLGVFGIAVATAAFPALSRAAKDGGDGFARVLRRGVRMSLFIALPASVGLIVVAPDLVDLLFGGGEPGTGSGFSDSGVERATGVLVLYSAAVWAYALNQLWTRAFYARSDTWTPMRIALWCVGLNLVMNVSLIWVMGESALALSTAVCAVLQTGLLAWALRRRVEGSLMDSGVWNALARIGAGTLLTGVGAVVGGWCGGALAGADASWARVLGAVALGGGVYLAFSAAFRAKELWWILGSSTDNG